MTIGRKQISLPPFSRMLTDLDEIWQESVVVRNTRKWVQFDQDAAWAV